MDIYKTFNFATFPKVAMSSSKREQLFQKLQKLNTTSSQNAVMAIILIYAMKNDKYTYTPNKFPYGIKKIQDIYEFDVSELPAQLQYMLLRLTIMVSGNEA